MIDLPAVGRHGQQQRPLALAAGQRHPVQAAATLDMSAFSGVIAYEPEELILDVGTATPLAEIEHMLAERGQQLADVAQVLRAAVC